MSVKDLIKAFYPVPVRKALALYEASVKKMDGLSVKMDRLTAQVNSLEHMNQALQRMLLTLSSCTNILPPPLYEYIVVSMTSYPPRFSSVCTALKSILRQTLKPARIVVYLDVSESAITDEMREMRDLGVEYRFDCENLKPHTKWFYAFKEFPDSLIITVDDDIAYPDTMVENLYRTHKIHPSCVVANRVHKICFDADRKILPYNSWVYECVSDVGPSHELFATGVGGVLYPPHVFREETFNTSRIKNECLGNDDVWLKFMELLSDVQVAWAPNPYFHLGSYVIKGSQECGLNNTNVSKSMNDVWIQNLMKVYGKDILFLGGDYGRL